MMVHDKHLREQLENDPRWEVRSVRDESQDPGGDRRALRLALVVLTVTIGLLGVVVWTTPPVF